MESQLEEEIAPFGTINRSLQAQRAKKWVLKFLREDEELTLENLLNNYGEQFKDLKMEKMFCHAEKKLIFILLVNRLYISTILKSIEKHGKGVFKLEAHWTPAKTLLSPSQSPHHTFVLNESIDTSFSSNSSLDGGWSAKLLQDYEWNYLYRKFIRLHSENPQEKVSTFIDNELLALLSTNPTEEKVDSFILEVPFLKRFALSWSNLNREA